MHREVHGSKDDPIRGLMVVAVPAVEHHRYVVIPVQEYEGLLPQNNEDGVTQLWNFGVNEELRKQARRADSIHEQMSFALCR
jgi:hypothetical protein